MLLAARYDDGGAMDDREVFDAMMTLVVAGHETTALALAWATWLLHRDDIGLVARNTVLGPARALRFVVDTPRLAA